MFKPIEIPRGQKWLTSRAKCLDYTSNDGGVCFGFANVAMYYFFMEPGKKHRLSAFNTMLEDIYSKPIETLQKMDCNKGSRLLNVKAFFEGIEVFQQPYRYGGIFNGKSPTQSTKTTIDTVFPEMNYESCAKVSGCYSKAELKSYLTSLDKEFKKAQEPVYLLLNATKHAIAISYDPGNPKHPWSFINANTGKAISLPIDKMVDQIFSGVTFNKKPKFGRENYANFSTEIFAYREPESKKKVQNAVNSWKLSEEYENLHKVTDKKLKRKDIWGKGWFYTAVRQGNEADVAEMLLVADDHAHTLEDYDSLDEISFSVLDIAAERGDVGIAKLLVDYAKKHPNESIDSESDLEFDSDTEESEPDRSSYHFLLHATKRGHPKFIEEFFDEKALVDLLDKGPNLFHIAAKNGHLDVIEALFNRMEEFQDQEKINAYINEQDDKGRSFLHVATAENHGDIVEFSLKYNEKHPDSKIVLNISQKDQSKLTFIERAVMLKGKENTVVDKVPRELIDYQTDDNPALQRVMALNGLLDAITKPSENLNDIIKIIISKPENPVAEKDNEGEKVEYHYVEDEALIVDGDGNTALHIAVEAGDLKVVSRILEAIPDAILKKNDNGQTPLHLACQKGNLELVTLLMEESDDKKTKKILLKRDENGDTALHIACRDGRAEIVNHLLKICPEKSREKLIKRENEWGQNLLHIAAFNGLSEVVNTILEMEADDEELNENLLTTMDNFGQTVLHYAVLSRDTKTVGTILTEERSEIINKADSEDIDPLLLAITQDDGEMVQFLLKILKKTDSDNKRFYSKAKNHESLLAFAVLGNHLEAVKVLVPAMQKAGIDIDELPLGECSEFAIPITPLALAMEMGYSECAEYLENNGANRNQAERNLKMLHSHLRFDNGDRAVSREHSKEPTLVLLPVEPHPVTQASSPVVATETTKTTEKNDSFFTGVHEFLTTPSLGRSCLIGAGIGILVVTAIVAILAISVGTSGIAPAVIGVGAAASLGSTAAGFSLAAIGAGIVGFFAAVAGAASSVSDKCQRRFESESNAEVKKVGSNDNQCTKDSTVSMMQWGLVPGKKSGSGSKSRDNLFSEKIQSDLSSSSYQDMSNSFDPDPTSRICY